MNAHVSAAHSQPAQVTAVPPPAPELSAAPRAFRGAMRKLAGAVSVITVGQGDERTGLTATSVTSLSVEPPTLLICVNRATSSVVPLLKERAFAINVLRPHHEPVADRFAGKGGLKGPARYGGADWTRLSTGAPVLADALAAFVASHCAGTVRVVAWATRKRAGCRLRSMSDMACLMVLSGSSRVEKCQLVFVNAFRAQPTLRIRSSKPQVSTNFTRRRKHNLMSA